MMELVTHGQIEDSEDLSEDSDLTETSPELRIHPGEIVSSPDSNYKISRLIGEGRCCVVYSGETVNSAEPVAIKFFRPGSMYLSAAEREWKVLHMLNSANVKTTVNLYAVTRHKGLVCFVLELLDLHVRQLITKNNRTGLPPWTIMKFCKDVLSCLDALHQLGFAHADVKPGNIMWSGQEGCFKCFDFGLSFRPGENSLHLTQSGGYRAPEVIEWNEFLENTRRRKMSRNGILQNMRPLNNNHSGMYHILKKAGDDEKSNGESPTEAGESLTEAAAPPGTKSDLWAFGCLLVEVVVGRKLVRAGDKNSNSCSSTQLMELRLEEAKERFAETDSLEFFYDIKDLLAKCLEKDPELRISAAAALNHPALRRPVVAGRQDNILLPSPVLRFNSKDLAGLQAVRARLPEYGKVVAVREERGTMYVHYMSLKQALAAKMHLSCEGTRDLDLRQEEDVVIIARQPKNPSPNFTTEFFPLDVWYTLLETGFLIEK